MVTSELRLATLGELKTSRSTKDLRDYLEILDAYEALEEERRVNESKIKVNN